jgi:hypothetical protein
MRVSSLVVGAVFMASLATASAGFRDPGGPVVVELDERRANAYLSATHNSADSIEQAGCAVHSFSTWGFVECFAVTSKGVFARCQVANPTPIMLAAATSIGDGQLYFEWDENGTCTQISSVNASAWLPRVHP